jgi:DNA-binding transcriptional ArsR family regulator
MMLLMGSQAPLRPAPARPAPGRPGRPRRTGSGSADRFAALADPTRRHLLEELAAGDRTVSQLMTGLQIGQAAVSQHLRVLREAGLTEAQRAGRHQRYRLRPAGLTELRDWLDELERFWQARLAALGEFLDDQHSSPERRGAVWTEEPERAGGVPGAAWTEEPATREGGASEGTPPGSGANTATREDGAPRAPLRGAGKGRDEGRH